MGTGVATGMRGFQGGSASIGNSALNSFNAYSTGISGRTSSPRRAPDPLAYSMRWAGQGSGGMVGARPAGLSNNFLINTRLSYQPIGGQLLTGQRLSGALSPTASTGFPSLSAGRGLGFKQMPSTTTQTSGLFSTNKADAAAALAGLESFDFGSFAGAGGFTSRFSSSSSRKFASLFSRKYSTLSSGRSLASKDNLAGGVLPQNLYSLSQGRTLLTGQTTSGRATSFSSLGGKASNFSFLGSRGLLGTTR